MGMTVADLENSFLLAKAAFDEFQAEFLRSWNAPVGSTALKMMWSRIPPEVKQQLEQMQPEAYGRARGLLEVQDASRQQASQEQDQISGLQNPPKFRLPRA
jgi:hypothetical protein